MTKMQHVKDIYLEHVERQNKTDDFAILVMSDQIGSQILFNGTVPYEKITIFM